MHIAPIGPHVNIELTAWTLKPFQSSTSFSNLRTHNRCVFHVIDNSFLMASAVLGFCNEPSKSQTKSSFDPTVLQQIPSLVQADFDPACGWILQSSCRYFGLQVQDWDLTEPRATANCKLTTQRELRPFWGWNRACHSILELSILASRVHMLEKKFIDEELAKHKIIIDKTAGPNEQAAWEMLFTHLSET